MANAPTHATDPTLSGVKIITLSPTNKSAGNRVALIEVDGRFLPNYFVFDDAKDATQAALSFYRDSVFNQVFDFSQVDQNEVQQRVLSAFVPADQVKKPRKNAAPSKEKGEDRRHAFAGKLWYVNSDNKPVRIAQDQIQEHLDIGFLPGKSWVTALAKHEGTNVKSKKGSPGYVNPICGKKLMHRAGYSNIRAEEDQVADLIRQGWKIGRPPKADQAATAAPAETVQGVPEPEDTEASPE